MDRRRFLTTSGIALSMSLAGCFGLYGNSGTTDKGSDDPGDDGGGSETPQKAIHSLFVENLDSEAHRINIKVVGDGGEPLIEGSYEIPDERGIEFQQEVQWGEQFEVTMTLESGLSGTFDWEIASCPGPKAEDGGSESPEGSRNGSVRIESGAEELSFVTDSCDEIIAGTEVATGPAGHYEAENSN